MSFPSVKTAALVAVTALASFTCAAPTTTPSQKYGAPNGNKKGLAYETGKSWVTDVLARPGSATWAYNWGAAQKAPKYQQIPMCHGPGSDCDGSGIMAKIAAGNTPWVLGYNEPDMTKAHGGCQATPQQARATWANDMLRFRSKGAKLVCPGVSSWNTASGDYGGASGLTWLRQFAGSNPAALQCDAQNIHWYGNAAVDAKQQASDFIAYLNFAHGEINSIFGREMDIWVTEFSPLPLNDVGRLNDFLAIVMPYMDKQPWIARYSPFMAEYLVSGNTLNQAGQTFVNTK